MTRKGCLPETTDVRVPKREDPFREFWKRSVDLPASRLELPIDSMTRYSDLPERFKDTQNKRPLTWREAREEERKLRSGENNRGTFNNTLANRAKANYARTLNADRHLREDYTRPYTVLLTFRASPTAGNHWTRPTKIARRLNYWVRKRLLKREFREILDGLEWEYVTVIAGNTRQATPHVHVYLWVDGRVEERDFENVRERFREGCQLPLPPPRSAVDVSVKSPSERAPKPVTDLDNTHGSVSRGARYVAKQIPGISASTNREWEHLATLHAAKVRSWSCSTGVNRNYEA